MVIATKILRLIQEIYSDEEAWKMTQSEFVKHHKTGYINPEAYSTYSTAEGISWQTKKDHPILLFTKKFGDKEIEFRKRDRKLSYTKTDEEGWIMYDDKQNPIYMTDQEVLDKGLPLHDIGIVAFDGDTAIGFASNEFGSTGVWVVDAYQKLGIGTTLLSTFRKEPSMSRRKLGQMTWRGEAAARAYHRHLVATAVAEGKPVPYKVLAQYPELQGKEKDTFKPREIDGSVNSFYVSPDRKILTFPSTVTEREFIADNLPKLFPDKAEEISKTLELYTWDSNRMLTVLRVNSTQELIKKIRENGWVYISKWMDNEGNKKWIAYVGNLEKSEISLMRWASYLIHDLPGEEDEIVSIRIGSDYYDVTVNDISSGNLSRLK